MSHHHHHNHITEEGTHSLNNVFIAGIALNILFVAIEAFVGFRYNSLGLLSDAGHNLSDVFSLVLALTAILLAKCPANQHFTYGYKKATVLISLFNSLALVIAVVIIIAESISRLAHMDINVSGKAISWTAATGIVINGLTTWLLMKDRKKDININSAFLHMLMDTLVSLGVVISGIIISMTGVLWIDPAISIIISIGILFSTYRLLKESLFMSLDAIPQSVNLKHVKSKIEVIEGLESWHHLHIWAISSTENAATIHIVVKTGYLPEDIKSRVRNILKQEGICHSTIECETAETKCEDSSCMKGN